MLNRFQTDSWKKDIWTSVDYYNNWFMSSAPEAYQIARKGVFEKVKRAFVSLDYLRQINAESIFRNPEVIAILRACTAPPIAVDRLCGLSYCNRSLISRLESGNLPTKICSEELNNRLSAISTIINNLLDVYLFPWLKDNSAPSFQAINRSAGIVADRLTGAQADPIIRNSQEKRQLTILTQYLTEKGYKLLSPKDIKSINDMPPFSFAYHVNCVVKQGEKKINMPIDMVIQTPETTKSGLLPLLIECKSAGDFANTNKRRKEEATKVTQLHNTYGDNIKFILFLCGYFDTSYLGYEASEGIDWIWEHRVSDLEYFGL